jgi:hypothetical protein
MWMCLASALRAQSWSDTFENLTVRVDGDWAIQGAPGYIPIRFDITNSGDNRVIEIVGTGQRYGGSENPGTINVRQEIALRARDHRHWTIPVPIGPQNEQIRFEVREGGRTLQTFNYVGFRGADSRASVLIVATSGSDVEAAAHGWLRSGSLYARPPSGGPIDVILDPSRLPENWLGYTSLRAVLIGLSEWSKLNEPQQNALLTWTAAGGDMIVLDGDPAAVFPKSQTGIAASEGAVRYFFGRVSSAKVEAITSAGLDNIVSATNRRPEESGLVLPVDRSSSWGQIGELGFRLPIPGVASVPARAYLWILLAFSLLIGPGNYIFLWRKRRQSLMVVTVPLISAVFVALLGGYAIAGEGFGVRARASTFTILDQTGNHAATRASVSLYAAGMSPGGGLSFPRDMAVFSMGTDGRGIREEWLDLTAIQRFTSGMIRARLPANFEEIGFRSARERVSFTGDDGAIEAFNGLGVTINRLYYRDRGTLYSLPEPLPPGTKARLNVVRVNAVPASFKEELKSAGPSAERFQYAADRLSDNSYAAVLERSPFWEAGVSSFDERGSFHFLVGVVEPRR